MKRMSRDTKFVLGGAALLAAVVGAIVWYEKRASSPPPAGGFTVSNAPVCPPGQFLDAHGYCEDNVRPPSAPTLNWTPPGIVPSIDHGVTGNAVTLLVGQTVNFNLSSGMNAQVDGLAVSSGIVSQSGTSYTGLRTGTAIVTVSLGGTALTQVILTVTT